MNTLYPLIEKLQVQLFASRIRRQHNEQQNHACLSLDHTIAIPFAKSPSWMSFNWELRPRDVPQDPNPYERKSNSRGRLRH